MFSIVLGWQQTKRAKDATYLGQKFQKNCIPKLAKCDTIAQTDYMVAPWALEFALILLPYIIRLKGNYYEALPVKIGSKYI